eukprot:TRINITY_DN3314_c0_g1_i1.p1 TRINITY_DN3314_c0_g1~~TRINITY_DN3314_c0_g1_i1.p1  ORF type:complete len:345 (-),score=74.45 TRINITY_DN3314_c0_g1_i1:53-1045(-)
MSGATSTSRAATAAPSSSSTHHRQAGVQRVSTAAQHVQPIGAAVHPTASMEYNEEFKQKFKHVTSWLRELYKNQAQIPSFETNPHTINILYEISKKNQLADEQHLLVIRDMEVRAEEYKNESRRLEEMLSSIGLPLQAMSHSGMASLRSLAALAVTLDLLDVQLSSYLMSLSDLSKEEFDIAEKRENEKVAQEILSAKTKAAMIELNDLKQTITRLSEELEAQKPDTEVQKQNLSYFASKSREYQATLHNLKENSRRSGVTEELFHHSLVRLSQEIEQVRKETAPMKTKLQAYHDLPPDIDLAMLQIQQARNQLAELEAALSLSLANIPM